MQRLHLAEVLLQRQIHQAVSVSYRQFQPLHQVLLWGVNPRRRISVRYRSLRQGSQEWGKWRVGNDWKETVPRLRETVRKPLQVASKQQADVIDCVQAEQLNDG